MHYPDPAKLIRRLRQDIGAVHPEAQCIDFHVNTKLAHILAAWENALHKNPNLSEAYNVWCGQATDYVACFPREGFHSRSGITGEVINPFRAMQTTFASNKQYQPHQIPCIVAKMRETAAEAGLFAQQDHLNLVELPIYSKLLPESALHEYCQLSHSPLPNQDFLLELEGSALLGEVRQTQLAHGTLYQPNQPEASMGQIVTKDLQTILQIPGYGGQLCEFPIHQANNLIVVVQLNSHQSTSITNLAEAVYATLKTNYPEARVFECYESEIHQLSEIVGGETGIEWIYQEADKPELAELFDLLNQHYQGPDLS